MTPSIDTIRYILVTEKLYAVRKSVNTVQKHWPNDCIICDYEN